MTMALCESGALTGVVVRPGIETEDLNVVVGLIRPRSTNKYSARQVQLPQIGNMPSTPVPRVQPSPIAESANAALPLAGEQPVGYGQMAPLPLSVKVPPVKEAEPENLTCPYARPPVAYQ